MKILKTLLIFSLSCQALAGLVSWDKEKKEKAFADYPLRIRNGFVSSMWGTINEPSINLDKETLFKGPVAVNKKWQGKSSFFESGFLKGQLLYWKDKKEKKPRPLYIIIPGSFSNLSTPQTIRYAHTLFKMGYNVIMLPNPLSVDYLKNKPKHAMGDVFSEVDGVNEAIGNWFSSEESKNIKTDSVNIVGTSYGGFVSAILSGTNRNWPYPLKKVFIISAPRYLMKSMLLIENYVVNGIKYMSRYKAIEFMKMLSNAFMIYIGGPKKNFLNDDVIKEIQSFVVIHGFQRLFIESLSYGQKVLGKNTYEGLNDVDNRDIYFKLKKSLRFSSYADKYLSKTKKRLGAEEGDLLYWLSRPEASDIEIRILTTADDWVNGTDIWPEDPGIFILPRGGHFGFRGGLWLDRLMREFF